MDHNAHHASIATLRQNIEIVREEIRKLKVVAARSKEQDAQLREYEHQLHTLQADYDAFTLEEENPAAAQVHVGMEERFNAHHRFASSTVALPPQRPDPTHVPPLKPQLQPPTSSEGDLSLSASQAAPSALATATPYVNIAAAPVSMEELKVALLRLLPHERAQLQRDLEARGIPNKWLKELVR